MGGRHASDGAARAYRGGSPGPVPGGDRPGRIGTAAAADRAGQALAARRVAGGIEPGHAGRAILPGQLDAADAAHRSLAAQRHRPALGKRIDKAAVERQKTIRLALAQPRCSSGPRLVVLRIDRPFEQRLGDHRITVASLGFEPCAVLARRNSPRRTAAPCSARSASARWHIATRIPCRTARRRLPPPSDSRPRSASAAPSIRSPNAQPPVASTTAPARTRQARPLCRSTPAAPTTAIAVAPAVRGRDDGRRS